MSSQVGKSQPPTTTEHRRAEHKPKGAEAIIVDETQLGDKKIDEPQTQTQTQAQPQAQTQTQPQAQPQTQPQQPPEQTRQRPQPFHYTVHYTTSSIDRDGQRETKEKFEMRNPELELTAERRPGQDLYDVRVEKKTGDKPEVITQQLPPNQVREHIDQCLKDTNKKLDETLRLEYRPEPTRPAIQGSEPWIRPTGQYQEPQRSLGLFERPSERSFDRDRPTERSVGLFDRDRPTERSLGLFERPTERSWGLLDRPFEGAVGRRSDVLNDPFRTYDSFDNDFRRMEDEFRRMREGMFRSFRDFERRWY